MTKDKDILIKQLNDLVKSPGGHQAARFLINAIAGAIPLAGGIISASGATWGEVEQQRFNEKIAEWARSANCDLARILHVLEDQLREPTKTAMALLVGKVFGIDLADFGRDISFQSILNGETRAEFEPFVERGWIQFTHNGNLTNMGAGNRIGNSIEDKKRPWGMGNGFNVYITPLYFSESNG